MRLNLITGKFLKNEPMANHTSWRCGGHAAFFFEPSSLKDLRVFLDAFKEKKEIFLVGLGSNLLVRDSGFDGVIISTSKFLNKMQWEREFSELHVECGVPCVKVARESAKKNKKGLEFFAGIPGTVGGALKMNAGANGSTTWQNIKSVDVISRDGKIKTLDRNCFNPGYRTINGQNQWFVKACFHLEQNPKMDGFAKIKEILSHRKMSQPMGFFSCGSVFINPENSFAGKLIEECGLKGVRVGGAVVSEKHANFILNDKGASASDIEELIELVRHQVYKKTGIRLECEVKIIGKKANE